MSNKSRQTANLVSDNNIFVDIVNDRVGIGTTNPTSKLSVVGNSTFTGIVTATGAINSSTDVQINGVSVLTSASNDAVALAIALG